MYKNMYMLFFYAWGTWMYFYLAPITWVLPPRSQMFHNCESFQGANTQENFTWAMVFVLPYNICSTFITFPKLDVLSLYMPYISQW
jgi:hypothetical protein